MNEVLFLLISTSQNSSRSLAHLPDLSRMIIHLAAFTIVFQWLFPIAKQFQIDPFDSSNAPGMIRFTGMYHADLAQQHGDRDDQLVLTY